MQEIIKVLSSDEQLNKNEGIFSLSYDFNFKILDKDFTVKVEKNIFTSNRITFSSADGKIYKGLYEMTHLRYLIAKMN